MRKLIGLALGVSLGLATPSAAAPILWTLVSINLAGNDHDCGQFGTFAASCDTGEFLYLDPQFPDYGTRPVRGTAAATAAFGALVVQNTISFGGRPQGGFPIGRANAFFADDLLLTGGSGTGLVQYQFSGTLLQITDSGPNGFLMSHDGNPSIGEWLNNNSNINKTFLFMSPLLPFTWGTPFELFVQAQARAQSEPGDGDPRAATTVHLDNIFVFDASGAPQSSYALTSAAGAPYATAVPEPGTLLLIGTGALGLLAKRRRRVR